jgi:NTE family protein
MSIHTPRKLALALGGGGVRGAAHLGVLRALQQANLEVGAIAGSSSGALAGMLFALETAGFRRKDEAPGTQTNAFGSRSRTEIYRLIEAIGSSGYAHLRQVLSNKPSKGFDLIDALKTLSGWQKVILSGVSGPGIASLEPLRQSLQPLVGSVCFEDLNLVLAFVATDLIAGEQVILKDGLLLESAIASCAIPGVFPPVFLDGRYLADGHVVNNVPVSVARELLPGAFVLAVDVGFDPPATVPKTAIEVILRAASISRDHLEREHMRRADMVLHVGQEVPSGVFDFEHSRELFEVGLLETRKIIPALREALGLEARALKPRKPGLLEKFLKRSDAPISK